MKLPKYTLFALLALAGLITSEANAATSVRARCSSTIAHVGDAITIVVDGKDDTISLVGLTAWVRGPGNFTSSSPWDGWQAVGNFPNTFNACDAKTAVGTFTPTTTGHYQVHANAYNLSGTYAGADIYSWTSWDAFASDSVVVADIEVVDTYDPAAVPQVKATSMPSDTFYVGDKITFLSSAQMSDGTSRITDLTAYWRGPGNYSVGSSPWDGWNYLLDDTSGAKSGFSSFTPTEPGNYQFHTNAYGNGQFAGTDINHWAQWNSFSTGPAIAANFTVLAPYYNFKIIIDVNQLRGYEANQIVDPSNPQYDPTFDAVDGVWATNLNTSMGVNKDGNATWNQVLSRLSSNWQKPIFSEDIFPDLTHLSGRPNSYDDLYSWTGQHPTASMCYLEPFVTETDYWFIDSRNYYYHNPAYQNETVITSSQVDSAHATTGNPIIVETRYYTDAADTFVFPGNISPDPGPAQAPITLLPGNWAPEPRQQTDATFTCPADVRNAVANPNCYGVTFELSAGQAQDSDFARWNDGIRYVLQHNKKCFVLISAYYLTTDYLQELQGAMNYFKQSGELGNPNLYFVLASYGRGDTPNTGSEKTGFFADESGSNGTNTLKAGFVWLKRFRNTGN